MRGLSILQSLVSPGLYNTNMNSRFRMRLATFSGYEI